MRVVRPTSDAVSEIVGNLLILMITVALFGVVLGFIYSIPGPDSALQAEIVPVLERSSAMDATLYLQHTGGEDLKEGAVYMIITINDAPTRYEISSGLGGKKVMEPGDVWTKAFAGSVPTSAKMDVRIVDTVNNNLLFYTVVQRGVASGGNHDPIVAYAWVDTTSGSDIIPNNDFTTFRIYAVCKDLDGNLPLTGSVTAQVTSINNGDGTFSITALGAGSTAMSDTKGDGVYLSGLLKVRNTVMPGNYIVTITATDDTARTATAKVKVTISTSSSILNLEGFDEAPPLLKSGDINKIFLRLKFISIGESIHVTKIRVTKLGTIADASCTVHCYWDKNGNGVLDIGTDYDLPGFGVFLGGTKDFIAIPLFTAIQETPTYAWVVLNIGGGTEGKSVGVRIESQAAVNAIGVSTPISIPPIGVFPIDSSIRTVKGVFKIWGYNEQPAVILTGTDDVKMIKLTFQSTGESVYIKNLNITLLGTVGRDQVTVYLKDQFSAFLTGDTPFDLGTGRCEFAAGGLGWLVDKAWASYDIYVYFNILGTSGNTIGVQLDGVDEVWAKTEISLDFLNPQSPLGVPIPNPPTIKTLQSKGECKHDFDGTATALPVRAGGVNQFMKRMLFRCFGEPIRFYSLNVTLQGTIPYDRVTGVRMVVAGSYPNVIAWSQTKTFGVGRWARFENTPTTIPMFTVNMDTNFYGYVYVDLYISLDHGTEGLTLGLTVDNAGKVPCEGQVTLASITVTSYNGPEDNFPLASSTRTINGQLYVYRTSYIPSPLVDSSQNVPVMKLTFKSEGQAVQVTQIIVRKLGIVAGNLVTVRLYGDPLNNTVNKLNADDVDLAPAQAGAFVLNAITFNPNFWVVPGTDFNVIIVFSLGLGTAGWTLGCSVSAAGDMGTLTAAPNNANAYPNQCLNAARNPPLVMTTPTVFISDRGTLTITPEDLSPSHVHDGSSYAFMKLTFWAEGESIDVNRIVVYMDNVTAFEPDWTGIRITLIGDLNNNSLYNAGDDWIDQMWLDSDGKASFLASPLFAVKPRTPYNLLVYISINWFVDGYLRMNFTDDSVIQSKGQVSGLSITPIATFPMMSAERPIW